MAQAEQLGDGWPKVKIEWDDPRRSREIVSIDEAGARFGLAERERGWLFRGDILGTSIRGNREVRMLHRYTLDDSVRDAARELLDACHAVMTLAYRVEAHSTIPLDQRGLAADLKAIVSPAIKKAERR